MRDVPVDFKSKSMVGLAPQDREQGTSLSAFMAHGGADRAKLSAYQDEFVH